MLEFRENIKIYKKDKNEYYTNTGCNITIGRDGRLRKLTIECNDRKPTYDEIKSIRYSLLGNLKTFFFNIDKYSNVVVLQEEHNRNVTKEYELKSTMGVEVDGVTYPTVISNSGGELHMSVSSVLEKYVSLETLIEIRNMLLPKDMEFVMYLPPEDEFINLHRNCFHVFELKK